MRTFICELYYHDPRCPQWQEKQKQNALDDCCKEKNEEEKYSIDNEFDGDF